MNQRIRSTSEGKSNFTKKEYLRIDDGGLRERRESERRSVLFWEIHEIEF